MEVEISGHRVGYRRVSNFEENAAGQLERRAFDVEFEDRASGTAARRPGLEAMLRHVHEGDTIVCQSMDRLARNLGDLRATLLGLTNRGVRVEFVREALEFTGEEDLLSKLLLSTMEAFAEFERSVALERRREGIALAKAEGKYKGRKAKLSAKEADDLRRRVDAGESKTALASEFGISRETLYAYLRRVSA